jgi:hypothetical protein
MDARAAAWEAGGKYGNVIDADTVSGSQCVSHKFPIPVNVGIIKCGPEADNEANHTLVYTHSQHSESNVTNTSTPP